MSTSRQFERLAAELCAAPISDRRDAVAAEIATMVRFSGTASAVGGEIRIESTPRASGAAERLSKLIHSAADHPVQVMREVAAGRPASVRAGGRAAGEVARSVGLLSPFNTAVVGLPAWLVTAAAGDVEVAGAALRGAALAAGGLISRDDHKAALVIGCPGLPAAMALRAVVRGAAGSALIREPGLLGGEGYRLIVWDRHGLGQVLAAMSADRFAARVEELSTRA